MTSSTLCLHAGARPVSYEELATIEAPEPTATWFPIPHAAVLDAVVDTLTAADYRVERLQLALGRNDARFFATLDLRTAIGDGVALSVGVRNSVDKSYVESVVMPDWVEISGPRQQILLRETA